MRDGRCAGALQRGAVRRYGIAGLVALITLGMSQGMVCRRVVLQSMLFGRGDDMVAGDDTR